MSDELREAKRAAEESRAAGLCPICDHAPHRDTGCPGCPCRYSKTLDADLDRFAEARHNFASTLHQRAILPLLRFFRIVR